MTGSQANVHIVWASVTPLALYSDICGSSLARQAFFLPGYYVPAPMVFYVSKLCLILHSQSGVNFYSPLSNVLIWGFHKLENSLHARKIMKLKLLE